jgi:hypothetical protein
MTQCMQPTVESLAYLAEILQDEYTEIGPLDRRALLLLVQMFQFGIEEEDDAEFPADVSELCDDPECEYCHGKGL